MTREELIKQAYIYGASMALQEVGFDKAAADETAVKVAMSGPELKQAIMALLARGQAGAAGAGRALGGAAQSAGGAIGGAAQSAGGAIGGAAQRAGGAVADAGRSVGGGAMDALQALKAQTAGATGQIGDFAQAVGPGYPNPQLQQMARMGLGAGALGGAGLGVGGALGGQALMGGEEE